MEEKVIWKYQELLHNNISNYTRRLFGRISNNLKPEIFFIGIQSNINDSIYTKIDNSSIITFPKQTYINTNLIRNIFILANKLFTTTPNVQDKKITQEPYKINLKNYMEKCIHKSLKEILYKSFQNSNQTLFLSYPVKINNYFTFAIIKFNTEEYLKYNSISKNNMTISNSSKIIYKSYIEALTEVLLEEIMEIFYKIQSDIYFDNIKTDINQLLRNAGELFINTTVPNIINKYNIDDKNEKLFEFCNYISSLNYEGKKNTSNLIFSNPDNSNLNKIIKFSKPISMTDYRNVRKLLEISNEDFYMYSDTNYIYGIATIKNKDMHNENIFIVNFYDTYKWELIYEKKTLMNVEYSFPFIKEKNLNKTMFVNSYNSIFKNSNPKILNLIWNYIENLIEEKKGTILLISNKASQEACRLSKQATLVNPTILNPDFIKKLSHIDGAILIDENSFCYAIGVILDGIASENGNPSRGSRYNSAIKYIDMHYPEALAIIISDDGMIDIYPKIN
ncbi:MAG: diadenylate cyclase [Candidatus Nanoarchaeia archaeon]|nr:diadenylate cyclase [Candidatus Nanoarchaeia archaeon]